MSEFIAFGEDYTDYIDSEETYNLFNRLKELEKVVADTPIYNCRKEFIESVQIDRKLKRLPLVKFIDINPNASLLN